MRLSRLLASVALLVLLVGSVSAQDKKGDDSPTLLTTHGVVDKADKDTLMVKPRGADGKFQKAIALKVTGTSKVTILTPQKRTEKTVLTQRDAEAKDLVSGQVVAVIYAEVGKESILLAVVAEPVPAK